MTTLSSVPETVEDLEALGLSLLDDLNLDSGEDPFPDDDDDDGVVDDETVIPDDVIRCYLAFEQGVLDPFVEEHGAPYPSSVKWAVLFGKHRLVRAVELALPQFYRNFDAEHGPALRIAARAGAKECVEAMISRGARAHQQHRHGDGGGRDEPSILCDVLSAMKRRRQHCRHGRSTGSAAAAPSASGSASGDEKGKDDDKDNDDDDDENDYTQPEPVDYDGVLDVLLSKARVPVGPDEVALAVEARSARVVVAGWKRGQLSVNALEDILIAGRGGAAEGGGGEALEIVGTEADDFQVFLVRLLEELGDHAVSRLPVFGRTGEGGGPLNGGIPDDVLCYRAMTRGFAPPSLSGRVRPPTNTKVPWTLLFAAHRRPDGVELALSLPRSDDDGDGINPTLDGGHPRLGSALVAAAKNGASRCVGMLIERGADANASFSPPHATYRLSVLKATLQLMKTWKSQQSAAVAANAGAVAVEAQEQAQTGASEPFARDEGKEDEGETSGHEEEEGDGILPQEPIDYDGVVRALLAGGAKVGRDEAELALDVDCKPVVEVALQGGELDLTELLAAAVIMTAETSNPNSGNDALSRKDKLKLLLDHGADPLAVSSEDLPFLDGGSMALLEIAIQSGSTDVVKILLEYAMWMSSSERVVESLERIFTRVLTFPITESLLGVLEEALSEVQKADLNAENTTSDERPSTFVANTNTFEIRSGTAWVGNMADFDQLLSEENPVPDKELQSNISFHEVAKGRWFVFTTPSMQVVAHHECSEEYLAGAVSGAIYGGFKEGEWNPLMPPASDVVFTGRMAYSEYEPRHVTWFTDPEASEFDEIRRAPVPDVGVLVGKLRNRVAMSGTLSHSAMWTSMQEYRYGILVGGKVFISVGYEGMDLNDDKISVILDSIMRAKQQCNSSPGRASSVPTVGDHGRSSALKRKYFVRTEFADSANIPKKRTQEEIFEKRLADGFRFSGLDFFRRITPDYPTRDSLTRFGPDERVYLEADVNPFLPKLGTVLIAESLVNGFLLLLDELIMMLLHHRLAPALVGAIAAYESEMNSANYDMDLQLIFTSAANTSFPNFSTKPSVDSYCHKALTTQNAMKSSNSSAALLDRIREFLSRREVSRVVLSKDDAVARVSSACTYIISELLELANNNRRDSGHSKLVPQHLRQAVLFDQQLFEACNGKQTRELYYPLHEEGGALASSQVLVSD